MSTPKQHVTTNQVRSVHELVDAIEMLYTKLNGAIWWRGQDEDHPLVPAVFRRPHWAQLEATQTFRFMNAARSRRVDCPRQEDLSAWLFLMQHFGFPTRLLDWSLSPLIAGFFAAERGNTSGKPGVIYALDALELNRKQGIGRIIPSAETQPVSQVVRPAFHQQYAQAKRHLAIAPSEVDARMQVQSSMFTIHCDATPLERLPNATKFLYKFIVPAGAKATLGGQIFSLGVRRQLIFPDIQNLGQALVEEIESHSMSGIPTPPPAKGSRSRKRSK